MSKVHGDADGVGDAGAEAPPGPGVSPAPASRGFLWGGLLLFLTFAAYLPVLQAGFIWDDDDYLVNNATLRTSGGLARIWLEPQASPQYYPLVFTTFWIENHLWGMNPAGYHIVNVLLHGLGAVLLWRVLCRLGVPGAWLAAALFAVHPVQVESVAWVAERKNVLSGFFYWAALLAYLRFAGLAGGRSRRWGWYAAALAFFLCALLSKTVTCTLPAVLVLLLWWKHGRFTLRDGLALAPLFVLGVAMGLSTAFLEVSHVGAAGSEYELGLAQRVLLAGRALWFYLSKLVWPAPLIFIYPRWHIDATQPWQYLYPAAAVLLAGVLWWVRKRLGWGPLVAYLCFAVTLFPALGFFNVYPFRYSFVADHFQYLACAPPLAALAALATLAARRWPPAVGRSLAGLLLVTLGVLAWSQAWIYRDALTVFQDAADKNPECWMAQNNLGSLYLRDGRFSKAESHYRQCLEIKPDHYRARRGLAQALLALHRVDDARAELLLARDALAEENRQASSDVQKQEIAQEYLDIGTLYERMGENPEAERMFRLALEGKPDWPTAHFRLGNSLAKQSRFAEAIPHLRVMTEASPDDADGYYYLAQALQAAGHVKEGAAAAAEALRLAEAAGNQPLVRAIRQRFASELPGAGKRNKESPQ